MNKIFNSKSLVIFMVMLMSISSAFATTYYRGDARAPDVIKAAGGLFPKGSEEVPPPALDMSLFNHVFGASYPATGYVSTSDDLPYVLNFFAPIGSYVYYIQGSENLIDVNTALGEYAGSFAREREFAAIGGIPWRQIVGWRLREDTPQILGPLIRNADYAGGAAFSGNGNSNIAEIAALTGFGRGHPAWRQYPWNQYPLPGCGNSQLRNAKAADQCLTSERIAEWKYLSKYRANLGITKKVTFNTGIDSAGLVFPTAVTTWIDMDGSGFLSLCGLFYDSEGSRTKITCARNKDGRSFVSVQASINDFGWAAGRAFTMQGGQVAYCRLVYISTHFACAKSSSQAFFDTDAISPFYIDGGYEDSRSWQSVSSNGNTSFCRITGTTYSGFYMNCDNSAGTVSFYMADAGWTNSRMWLDMTGKGVGHDSFCRIVGSSTFKVQCTLRMDNYWSGDITSGSITPGTDGYRFPVRMTGPAQEYCRVTGGYYDYLTCTYLNKQNKLVDYAVSLPRFINPRVLSTVSFSDVDGDSRDDLCFLDGPGKAVYCYLNQGGYFSKNAITLQLRNPPVGDFAGKTVKIMPVTYTNQGPAATVCYNSGGGWMTCDQSWVY